MLSLLPEKVVVHLDFIIIIIIIIIITIIIIIVVVVPQTCSWSLEQALLIHSSAKNFLAIRYLLSIPGFCISGAESEQF
jgi:hypothetical protein